MSETQQFRVTGMSCEHCENAVSEELQGLSGLSDIAVSAAEGTVTLTNDGSITEEQIIAAIDEAGYTAAKA